MNDLLLQKANKIIVFDGFNRADNATTLGNADTGQTWVAVYGTWGIQNSQAYVVTLAGVTFDRVVLNSGVSNCAITVKISTQSGYGRVIFRHTNADNEWNLACGVSSYTLSKRVSGSSTTMGTYSVTPVNGDIIKIMSNQASIQVFVNEALAITISDAFNQSATSHGLGNSGNTNIRFDDYSVEAI